MRALLSGALTLALGVSAAAAALPDYRPAERVTGEIRVWGSPADGRLLAAWSAGFHEFQPGAHVSSLLHGPDSTMGGVTAGVADLALMAREMRLPVESMAFEWVYQYKPFSVEIANGGLTTGRPAADLAIFVRRGNPLTRLTLAQIDGIFGAEHRRGGRNLRLWGDLGLAGAWKDRPIHVYGPFVDSVPAAFIRNKILGGSEKWNSAYHELGSGAAIFAALAQDPDGIAFAPLPGAGPAVKPLALADGDGAPAVLPSHASIAGRTYPLGRVVTMVANRPPAAPLPPLVKEFLLYVLSRQGQEAVARDGAYVPLDEESVQRQRGRLNSAPVAEKKDYPDLDLPPAYVPRQPVSGTIRIWGHGAFAHRQDFIETLVKTWEDGFNKIQPALRFDNRLYGTASAIGALYTGVGDLALMGREIWPNEISGFREVFSYPPTGIDIVTGSYDVRNHGYAVVFFVHKDNPLTGLTLAQLAAAFCADHPGSAAPARTWGDLGLTGAWKDRPIHLYGLPIARGFAEYIEEAVFGGARKWDPSLREFADQPGATDGGQRMLDAMARDPDALGYAGLLYYNPAVKPLALARRAGGPYVAASRASVMDHSYPLSRMITLFLNRAPGRPVDPRLKEFIRYILSREGQEAVLRVGGGYLPVLAPDALRQLDKLDDKRTSAR